VLTVLGKLFLALYGITTSVGTGNSLAAVDLRFVSLKLVSSAVLLPALVTNNFLAAHMRASYKVSVGPTRSTVNIRVSLVRVSNDAYVPSGLIDVLLVLAGGL
jgi:hypothetical protein